MVELGYTSDLGSEASAIKSSSLFLSTICAIGETSRHVGLKNLSSGTRSSRVWRTTWDKQQGTEQ